MSYCPDFFDSLIGIFFQIIDLVLGKPSLIHGSHQISATIPKCLFEDTSSSIDIVLHEQVILVFLTVGDAGQINSLFQ